MLAWGYYEAEGVNQEFYLLLSLLLEHRTSPWFSQSQSRGSIAA